MRFVKFKEENVDITIGKEYKIEFETELEVCIIDDDGDLSTLNKARYYIEIIDRPVIVKAFDDPGVSGIELELIHDLGDEFEFRYVCNNDGNISGWRKIEYIEEKLTLEQRIERLEQLINNK